MSWTYTLNPNWPHTVDCGEDELVVSQTPVELVGAFLQKVDGHLNSLWSKQFLCAAGCLQFKNLSTLTYNSHRTVALGLIISALPFCAYRFHTALKVSVEYPTLSPRWRHHPHQSLLPFALKSLGKHNREVRIEHIYQVEISAHVYLSLYPKAGWWFLDHRGPVWLSLHLKTPQISALWYNVASGPFYCPVLLRGHCYPDNGEHLGDMRKYPLLWDLTDSCENIVNGLQCPTIFDCNFRAFGIVW